MKKHNYREANVCGDCENLRGNTPEPMSFEIWVCGIHGHRMDNDKVFRMVCDDFEREEE